MTAAEVSLEQSHPTRPSGSRSPWRPLLAFGTGVAIEIAGDALEVAVVRVRPGGPELLRRVTIQKFRERPAAEWSLEFRDALRGHQPGGVTVLLPRRDVIVRHVHLPGVHQRELTGALALRLRSLHPFAEDDVAWCWAPVTNGALVGLTRLTTLARYESLFAEAGVPVARFTFSASALHSAVRLFGEPALPFLAVAETAANVFEAYGENTLGTIFSGEFTGAAARAAAAGIADLRMRDEADVVGLAQILPRGAERAGAPFSDRPLLFAAGIVAGAPLLTRTANFLPPERRAGQSRLWLVPTIALALLLVVCAVAMVAMGPYRERRYIQTLHEEIAKVEPRARRVAALDKDVAHAREQIQLLDRFRGRSQADFDVLNELTRILAPPTWATLVEVYPDYVVIAGQAEQAAPLLKVIDSSPLFQNSEFLNSVSRSGKDEVFRIKTYRRHK